ncbi:MAG: hypothetical protein PQJ60_02295, partial [Spirochaetales bacterium]|nr:hypothetical protein [Spirochaetales bacterium]
TATAGAGPLFHRVAAVVNDTYPPGSRVIWPTPPEGIYLGEVCTRSGMTPGPYCGATQWVYRSSEQDRSQVCTVHRMVEISQETGLPAPAGEKGPVEQKVFEYLPSEYAVWEAEMGREKPPHLGETYQNDRAPQLTIIQPEEGDIYLFEPGYNRDTQSVELLLRTSLTPPTVSWYVNGRLHSQVPWPYTTSLKAEPGHYEIYAAYDTEKSPSVSIEIK